MARRIHKSFTDYMVLGVTPALLIVMISALAFYLIACFYGGVHDLRLKFIAAMFVMGSVLITRIAIEEGKEHAGLFALPLGLAVFVAAQKFVQLGAFLNLALIATIWWSAHKLTWDSTVIDDEEGSTGEGLLETLQSDRPDSDSPDAIDATEATTQKAGQAEEGDASQPPTPLWKQWLAPQKRPHNPGKWVIYFALGSLPLLALGNLNVHEGNRGPAFRALSLYVAAALSVLLATSFLGLRKYLRQRRLEMPLEMAGVWLACGLAIIGIVMVCCLVLPRPGVVLAGESTTWTFGSKRLDQASNYGQGSDAADSDQGRAGKTDPQSDSTQSADSQAKGKQEGGQSGKSDSGKSGKSDSEKSGKSDGGKSGKSDSGKSGKSDSGKSGKSDGGKSGKSDSGKSGKSDSGKSGKSDGGKSGKSDGGKSGKSDSGKSGKSDGGKSGKSDGGKSGKSDSGKSGKSDSGKSGKSEDAKSDGSKSGEADGGKSNKSGKAASDNASNSNKQSSGRSFEQKSSSPKDSSQESKASGQKSGNASSSWSQAVRSLPRLGLRVIYWLGLILLVVYLLIRYREEVMAAWRQFVEDLRRLWARLFGGSEREAREELGEETRTPAAMQTRFADFVNPFLTDGWRQQTAEALVQYSFAASEAWGREHACPRGPEQTPLEFARAIGSTHPDLAKHTAALGQLYTHAAYGPRQLPPDSVEHLRRLWDALATHRATPPPPPASYAAAPPAPPIPPAPPTPSS